MKKITFLIVLLTLSFSCYVSAQITNNLFSDNFEDGDGSWVITDEATVAGSFDSTANDNPVVTARYTAFGKADSTTTKPRATSANVNVCDDESNDSVEAFDLTANDQFILDVQNSSNFSVSYYASETNATAGISALSSPYLNIANPQIIWARVNNNLVENSYTIVNFEISVNEVPTTTLSSDWDYQILNNAKSPSVITAIPNNYLASEVDIVWYRDGVEIIGQKDLKLPVSIEGYYEIEVAFLGTRCAAKAIGESVIALGDFVLPKGISPGVSPGFNDNFDLSNFDVSKIEIFNRLGRLVYSKTNYTNEWHGQSDKGDELPVGTYFYTMTYQGDQQLSSWVYINK